MRADLILLAASIRGDLAGRLALVLREARKLRAIYREEIERFLAFVRALA